MSYGQGLSDFLSDLGITSMGSLTDVVNSVGLPEWLEVTDTDPDAWDIGQMMLYKFFSPRISGYIPDTYDHRCQGKKIVLDIRREFNQNNDFFCGVYEWLSDHQIDPKNFVLLTGNMRASEMLERFKRQKLSEGTPITSDINIYSDPYYFSYLNKYLSEFYDYSAPCHDVTHNRFKCYNNWSKPHRLCLYLQLKAKNLISGNKVSYLNNDGYTVDNNVKRFPEFMADQSHNIARASDILPALCARHPEHSEFYHRYYNESEFPVRSDAFDTKTNHHIYFNYPAEWVDRTDMSDTQRQSERAMSFPFDDVDFDIVTETVGDTDDWMALFVTEKTLKPMLFGLPVFVVAPRYTLAMIQRTHGLESSEPYIDESYDSISDMHDRIAHIVNQVCDIMAMNDSDYSEWLMNVRQIAHRNREHILKNLQ